MDEQTLLPESYIGICAGAHVLEYDHAVGEGVAVI